MVKIMMSFYYSKEISEKLEDYSRILVFTKFNDSTPVSKILKEKGIDSSLYEFDGTIRINEEEMFSKIREYNPEFIFVNCN